MAFEYSSITVDMVQRAIHELLEDRVTESIIYAQSALRQTSESFYVEPTCETSLKELGIHSIEGIVQPLVPIRHNKPEKLQPSRLMSLPM